MIRFKLILEVIQQENLVQNAASKGRYLLERLHELSRSHPEVVSNVRGIGLICAFDLPDKETRDEVVKRSLENKMIILGCGAKSIRFRPQLNVSTSEIDQAMDVLKKVISDLS